MSPPVGQATSSDAGFTLLEMLVALALIGLLTAALFGGLRFAARASDRTTATTDHASELALAYGFLQAQLGNAQPYPATADPKDQEIVFDGLPDQIDLITTVPTRLIAGGFLRLHLVGTRGGEQSRLMAGWEGAPRRDDALPPAALVSATLLDRLKAIRFAFFGALDPDDPSDWHDRWQGVRTLPKMIRLRVEFADGWQAPDLIVAPRLAEISGAGG